MAEAFGSKFCRLPNEFVLFIALFLSDCDVLGFRCLEPYFTNDLTYSSGKIIMDFLFF